MIIRPARGLGSGHRSASAGRAARSVIIGVICMQSVEFLRLLGVSQRQRSPAAAVGPEDGCLAAWSAAWLPESLNSLRARLISLKKSALPGAMVCQQLSFNGGRTRTRSHYFWDFGVAKIGGPDLDAGPSHARVAGLQAVR